MRATEVLEAIVLHPAGESRHEPSMRVAQDGEYVAIGVMVDPDGREWKVRVERIGEL